MIFCLIQFLFTFICNSFGEFVNDYEYLIQDVVIAMHFAFHFGRTESYKGPLAPNTPLTSILDFSPLLSIAGHFLISLAFQVLAVYMITFFQWYSHADDLCHFNNYSLYMTSLFQLVITVLCVSRGEPYRKPLYSNYFFTFSIALITALLLYSTLLTPEWLSEVFDFCQPPNIQYPMVLVSLACVNFVISAIFEKIIIDNLLFKRFRYLNCNERSTKRRYADLETESTDYNKINSFLRTFDNKQALFVKEEETSVL